MADFLSEARAVLDPVAAHFGLTFAAADDSTALLVGRGYALVFMADFDDVKLAYAERDRDLGFRLVGITTYVITQRFTEQDSAQFGKPVGRAAHVVASLRVLASGLANHCQDMLNGDVEWLRRLRRKDPARWAGVAAPPGIAAVLQRAMTPLALA